MIIVYGIIETTQTFFDLTSLSPIRLYKNITCSPTLLFKQKHTTNPPHTGAGLDMGIETEFSSVL